MSHRREFAVLGYCTVAPRLPSGTLVNKTRQQAQRCLVMGYSGSETGAYERLGHTKSQPGYICLLDGLEEYITPDVRIIPGCFPGFTRTDGGGWIVDAEKIPFSPEARAKAGKQLDSSDEQVPKDKPQAGDLIDVDGNFDPSTYQADDDGRGTGWARGFAPDMPLDAKSRGVMRCANGLMAASKPQPRTRPPLTPKPHLHQRRNQIGSSLIRSGPTTPATSTTVAGGRSPS